MCAGAGLRISDQTEPEVMSKTNISVIPDQVRNDSFFQVNADVIVGR